jgi:DNA-binding transcriptional regulator YiaG
VANHPNRRVWRGEQPPAPEAIRDWRRDRGLSASEAAALVHSTQRVWQQWEAGERRMHPAMWELARTKKGPKP